MLTDWEHMDPALRTKERRSWALHVAEGFLVLLGPPLLAVAIVVYALYRSFETTPWEPDGTRRPAMEAAQEAAALRHGG